MKGFDDISIRSRLSLLIALSTLFFLLFFLFSSFVSERNSEHLDYVGSSSLPMVTRLYQVDYQFLLVRDKFSDAISDRDEDALADAVRTAAKLQHELNEIAALEPGAASTVTAFTAYASEARRLAAANLAGTVAPDQLYSAISTVKADEGDFRQKFTAFKNSYIAGFNVWMRQARRDNLHMRGVGIVLGLSALGLMLLAGWRISRSIRGGLQEAVTVAQAIADGNWDAPITVRRRDETGQLLSAIHTMRSTLQARQEADRRREAHATVQVQLAERMRRALSLEQLCRNILDYLAAALPAPVGVFYVYDDGEHCLHAVATHALGEHPNRIALGEGLVGQAAQERRLMVMEDVPQDYLTIRAGALEATPRQILILPLLHNDILVGVLELGSVERYDDERIGLLEDCRESIAVSLTVALSHSRPAATSVPA